MKVVFCFTPTTKTFLEDNVLFYTLVSKGRLIMVGPIYQKSKHPESCYNLSTTLILAM